MWIGESIHLTHQPVVGWVGLQNFWLTIKWVGLSSHFSTRLVMNPDLTTLTCLYVISKVRW